jgi:hypothetical protein
VTDISETINTANIAPIPGGAELTESENALLAVFTRCEGHGIGAEYLCEQALKKPMTDGGLEVTRLIASLREKLRGSGRVIREEEVRVRDADDPGEVYHWTEYTFARGQPPDE